MSEESDWKLFRKKLPQWQERHMQKLLDDYAAIIAAPSLASDRFWALENRLRRDVRHTGVRAEMRRSMMHQNIARLLNEGSITVEDLEDFSDEIKDLAGSVPPPLCGRKRTMHEAAFAVGSQITISPAPEESCRRKH